jgi:hypothetical protein
MWECSNGGDAFRNYPEAIPSWVLLETPEQIGDTSIILAAGWPMKALVGRQYLQFDFDARPGTFREHIGHERGVLRFGHDAPRKGWLPIAPLWPGFVIDTALYGCPVLIGFGASDIRRWRRRRRGLCAHCAYDLRGLSKGAACPECGRELSA